MAGKNETSVGVKFTADSTGFERIVKGMISSSNLLKGTIGSIGLNQFFELGKKGWEGYKKVMESTEGTADKLEAQIALLDGAMGGLVRTIATSSYGEGGFGTLIKNMGLAAEATRDMKSALNEYEHAVAGTTIKKGRLTLGFQEARVNAAEATDPEEKKKYLSEAIDLRKELTDVEVEEISKRLGITEEYYKKLTGHSDEYFQYFMEQVPKLAQEYDYFFGENSTVLEMLKKRISDIDYHMTAVIMSPEEKKKFEEERHQLNLTRLVLEDYRTIQDDFSKKGQWDEFIKGIGEMSFVAADGEKALLRLVKQLAALKDEQDLKSMKDFNSRDSYGYKIGKKQAGRGLTDILKNQTYGTWTVPDNPNAIQPYRGGLNRSEIKSIQETNAELENEIQTVDTLSGVFDDMFANIGDGFEGMSEAITSGLERIAAELVGKAALFTLMSILFPEGTIATGGFKAFLGLGSSIPKHGNGTNYAPGGLSLVGENGPELVNLPRGSRVTPLRNQSVGLNASISAGTIYLSGTYYQNILGNNT